MSEPKDGGSAPDPGPAIEAGTAAGAGPAPEVEGARLPDLRRLYAPRSVAIVGASPRSTIGPLLRDNVAALNPDLPCWFVNPSHREAWGSPVYPSLAALPAVPDLVAIVVNPIRAAAVAEEAGRLGVGALVIPGGGVVEGGPAAAAMQADVRRSAVRHGIAVLGPNCMGLVDFTTDLAMYIDDLSPALPRGGVAAIAQSGSVANTFLMSGRRTGFSRVVSCGAEAALDLCDHLAWSLDDPETHAVALFVEGLRRPERFLALADRALHLGKPIAMVKVGRSSVARDAAIAHTGNLAGEDRALDAAFEAVGIVRCRDLDELLEQVEVFEGMRRTGRGIGRGRVGLVTVSTGEASLVADLAEEVGTTLPPLPDSARSAILEALPTMGHLANPLDPWGAADAPEAYRIAFGALAASGAYDVLGLVHDFPFDSQASELETNLTTLEPLLEAAASRPDLLPLVISLTSGEPPPELIARLDRLPGGRPPVLRGAPEALRALRAAATWQGNHERRTEPRAAARRPGWPALATDRTPAAWDEATGGVAIGDAASRGPASPGDATASIPTPRTRTLSEARSLDLLAAAGVAVARTGEAEDAPGAAALAERFDGPVALKLSADGLAHASDVGGVILGVTGEPAAHEAAETLLARARALGVPRPRIVVQRMHAGVELLVGARRDPQVGPLVVIGLGGVQAEALDDVALALAPLDPATASGLLERLRGRRLLDGFRGGPVVDRAAVGRLVAALGRFIVDRPDILEVDLNPVMAEAMGAVAVDALVVVAVEPTPDAGLG